MSMTVSAYMNQYYHQYRYGVTTDGRSTQDTRSLSTADMHAMKAALKDLEDYDYEDGDGEDLTKKIQAYVETYNHFIDSTDAYGDSDTGRYLGKVKKLTKEQQDKLEDIGVTIQSDGKLKVDEEKLGKTSRIKVEKVFGADSGYGVKLNKYMKSISDTARRKNLGVPVQDKKLYKSIQEKLNDSQVDYSI